MNELALRALLLFLLQIWDFPGQIDFFDPAFDSEVLFANCGALVFVIDAQVNYIKMCNDTEQN